MSNFSVRVVRIAEPVVDHPDADRLSLVRIGGYTAISNKLEDGTPRYKQGDFVVYIPEAAVLPEWLLKRLDMWNEETGKGMLAGADGNRVKIIKLRGIYSQGILFSCRNRWLEAESGTTYLVDEGQDVAELLGISKYEPPIPVEMAGEVCSLFGYTMKYDFENLQSVPDMFEEGEEVVATEKLNGTHWQFGYIPGLNNPELFCNGDVYVISKGLGNQGLAFKNNEKNQENLYVRELSKVLKFIYPRVVSWSRDAGNSPIHIFGEIFGGSIQASSYGQKEPSLRLFDIAVGREFLDHDDMISFARHLEILRVPPLYVGPFSMEALLPFRDGKSTLSRKQIKEGLVVKTLRESRHPMHGRKIAKMINPQYLLKATGEEIN